MFMLSKTLTSALMLEEKSTINHRQLYQIFSSIESWYVVIGKQLILLPWSQIIVKYLYNNEKHDTVELLGILNSATAEELSY